MEQASSLSETTGKMPVPQATDFRGIVDFHVAKDRLWLLSVQAAAREGGPAAMRVDAFDRATGAPLQAQVLPNVFPGGRLYGWRRERSEDENRGSVPPTQVVWTPGAWRAEPHSGGRC